MIDKDSNSFRNFKATLLEIITNLEQTKELIKANLVANEKLTVIKRKRNKSSIESFYMIIGVVLRQVAACFVLEGEDKTIKGYYTLSADSVDRTLIPEQLQKKLPYKNLPVTLLGRLARDSNYKGQGVGELLLADALKRAYQAGSTIGACAVVTDPINEKARAFDESFGFISLESGRLFIPMETIKVLFP